MSASPWVDAWRPIPDDGELDGIVERYAIPIRSEQREPFEIAQEFAAAAEEIFVCDPQSRLLIREVLAAGRAYTVRNYPSIAYFDDQMASSKPRRRANAAIVLDGHSGVGKTQLVNAIERLLRKRAGTVNTETLRQLPLRVVWRAEFEGTRSVGDIIEQLIASEGETDASIKDSAVRGRPAEKRLLTRVKRRSYRDGVGLVLADEMQFGSNGERCAWVVTLLLQLLGLGPMLIYVTNFNLMHKLAKRPPQDRRRLLSRELTMRPFEAPDSDWIRFVKEVMKIIPEAWAFRAESEAAELLRYTFGIRDNLIDLLRVALLIAGGQQVNAQVTKDILRAAYNSSGYADRRDIVEVLIAGSAVRLGITDLYSPLRERRGRAEANGSGVASNMAPGMPPQVDTKTGQGTASNVVQAEKAINERKQRVLDAMQEEQLQRPKRELVEDQRRTRAAQRPKAKVIAFDPNRRPSSLEDVINAAVDLVDDRQ
ncbi:MAG: hypothetical protein ACT4P0_05710 [Panacagrimonas sp.]